MIAPRRPARGALARVSIVLVVAAAALSGCGGGARTRDLIEHRAPGVGAAIATARLEALANPSEPYWPFHLGELYLDAGAASDGESFLRDALELDPRYAPALALLSKLHFETHRHAEAIRYLEPARGDPGAFPDGFPDELRAGLAVHYDAIGEVALAESLVAGVSPRESGIVSALTYVSLRGDGAESAAALAESALEQDPRNAVHLNNYGITRLRAGDPHEAKRAFTEANSIDPSLPGPYYNMAIVERFYFLDDDGARSWFERYWSLSHEDPDRLATVMLGKRRKGRDR